MSAELVRQTSRTATFLTALAAVLLVIVSGPAWSGEYEDANADCLLKHAARGVTAEAVRAAKEACLAKTTPKKCRAASMTCDYREWIKVVRPLNPDWSEADLAQYWMENYAFGNCPRADECKRTCEGASYVSRKFGECAIDSY